MGLFPLFLPTKFSIRFLQPPMRGVFMINSWSPVSEENVILGWMKIIDGSLWLRKLYVTCDTPNVLTVEQIRTTLLKHKSGHHLIDKFHDILHVCLSLPNRRGMAFTSKTLEWGLKNVSNLFVPLKARKLWGRANFHVKTQCIFNFGIASSVLSEQTDLINVPSVF